MTDDFEYMMSDFDYDDIIITVFALHIIGDELDGLICKYESLLAAHVKEQRRLNRALPAEKKRIPWSHFCLQISDHHFKRMFRMEPAVFKLLCQKVCSAVGEDTFKPEDFLMRTGGANRVMKRISGEIKMAFCIRMLAGGSYLDLVPLFHTSTGYLYQVFDVFLGWILCTMDFPLVGWLREQNWNAVESLANSFAEKSNGVFYGPFGALDGLALRIKSPTLSEVADPGNYYCRKGFYALNVQAICDRHKRFLYCYPSN